ncbi:MAG: hypothetical protein ACKV0T_28900 [Planctomycetales bacterium]
MPVDIELADDIYRERVLRARRTPPEDKLLAGAEIFDRVCSIMASGIRADFPEADEDEVDRILLQRLQLARRLENVH